MSTATATRTTRPTTRRARPARKAEAVAPDQVKADAEAVIDGLVSGTPAEAMEFLERLAAERARAQQLGVFKLWSINNRCYLEGQVRRRRASVKNLFAGVKQWESMGRRVLDEELGKPYKIQGSPFYTVAGDPDPVTGEETRVERFGRAAQISVYDWTQTISTVEGYVEPDWEVPVAAGDLTTLRQLAESAPAVVRFEDLGSKNAHATFDGTTITIDSSIPVGNQIFTLATQIAHRHLGHPDDVCAPGPGTRRHRIAELTAERDLLRSEATLVGWMVSRALGLDADTDGAVTKLAQSYLHSWTKVNADGTTMELAGTKSRRKLLRARMGDAIVAADAILGAYCDAGRAVATQH